MTTKVNEEKSSKNKLHYLCGGKNFVVCVCVFVFHCVKI